MRNVELITIILNGSCNLQCEYCFINKDNKAIFTQITKELLNAIDQGIYVTRIMNVLPTKEERENVKGISFWGGEPTLHLDYAFKLILQLVEILPNLRNLHFSSNFSLPDAAERMETFLSQLSTLHKDRFPFSRPFQVNIQISVDGPSIINDNNRGLHTSDQIFENFKRLIIQIPVLADGKHLRYYTHTHGVCDTEKLIYLSTNEHIYNFFHYFYQYYLFLKENHISQGCNGYSITVIPGDNFMFPGKETSYTGKIAAASMQGFYEFYTKTDSLYFQFEESFRDKIYAWFPGNGLIHRRMRSMFNAGRRMNLKTLLEAREEFLTHKIRSHAETMEFCGAGDTEMLITPDDHTYAICQNIVFDRYPEYLDQFSKINSPNSKFIKNENINYPDEIHRWIFNSDEAYAKFEKNIKASKEYIRNGGYYGDELLAQAMIETAAKVGVIDPKYKDPIEYKFAAKYVLADVHCISSFLQLTGSLFTPPGYFIPLLLNGAMDYIDKLIVLALDKEISKHEGAKKSE